MKIFSVRLRIFTIILTLISAQLVLAQDKPNIIFIMSDDLGYGDLGSYGQQNIQTPELDKMASEGIRFTQHYAGAPLCAPTRVSVLTGKHTGHTSVRQNKISKLMDGEETLGTVLQRAGYVTGAIGKWGAGWDLEPDNPAKFGFDYFFGYVNQSHAHNYYTSFLYRNGEKVYLDNVVPGEEQSGKFEGMGYATVRNDYTHDLFTEDALKYIEDNKDSSFFLHLCYTIPHVNNEADDTLELEVPDLGIYENMDGWTKPMKAYASLISRMDTDVGRIIEKLKDLEIDENTIVLFTGDNGPHKKGGYHPDLHNSAGPLRDIKFSMYEGGVRVPLVVRWPTHIQPNTVTDHQAAFWDFMATACDIAGIEPPEDCDGISYLPTLLGETEQAEHEYLYWERNIPTWKAQQAIRWGNWKGVRELKWNDVNDPNFWPKMELYNLADDIGESTDLANVYPEIVEQLEYLMVEAHQPDPTGNLRTIPPFLTDIEDELVNQIPGEFILHQNYPNPFNPSTTIKYNLLSSGAVQIKIFDSAGQEIETLLDSFQTSGEHETTWQPKGLASGIYFCRLQFYAPGRARGYTETRKLILQK